MTADKPDELTGTEEILAALRKVGHWRVVIRPTTFERKRISKINGCYELIQGASVSHRGWPYPACIDRGKEAGPEFSGFALAGLEWGILEAWRYFQSGQFVHKFALREDVRTSRQDDEEPGPVLDWIRACHSVAEIFEFAARLSLQGVLPSARIQIQIRGTKGRRLSCSDPRRLFFPPSPCRVPIVEHVVEVTGGDLVSREEELVISAAKEMFAQFLWDPAEAVLRDERQRLMAMRG